MRRHGRVLSLFVAAVAVAGAVAVGGAHADSTPGTLGQLVTSAAACPGDTTTPYSAATDGYSLYNQLHGIGVEAFYQEGYFGQNPDGSPIGIAMIDSGVAPVQGLDYRNVVDGPDLSFESQAPYASGAGSSPNTDLPHNDVFGHGTHMAGIMVGRDDSNGSTANGHVPYSWNDPTKFTGVAPGARVISLKVADAEGAVDITQVIAAVDWVVQHRNDPGLDIRVLNLSYGVYGTDSAHVDALTYAVDQAWKAGIVVVAAAGNAGNSGIHSALPAPAYDPRIIAVGAFDNGGTPDNIGDDTTANFTTNDSTRQPDLTAPGTHVMSLHAVGSEADDQITAACQAAIAAGKPYNSPFFGPGGRFVRGSGTSQAAAIISGSVALLLSQRPALTPDDVKALFDSSTSTYDGTSAQRVMSAKGGEIWLEAVADVWTPKYTPTAFRVNGGGTLGAGRGKQPLPCLTVASVTALRGTVIPGTTPKEYQGGVCSNIANQFAGQPSALAAYMERDVRGMPFDSAAHATQEATRVTWTSTPNGEMWNGAAWTGAGYTWSPLLQRIVRNGVQWPGSDWLSHFWTSHDWTTNHWTTNHWTDSAWLGHFWTDNQWADNSWS